jgi:hypothetical protein
MDTIVLAPPRNDWRPFNEGTSAFPIAEVKTDTHKKLRAAWDHWHDREEKARALQQARQEAVHAAEVAHIALQEELAVESESGQVGKSPQLKIALESLIAAADPELWETRISGAENLAREAQYAYVVVLEEVKWELLEELRPEAEKVAEEYRKVQAEVNKRLLPIEQRHRSLAASANLLLGRTEPFTAVELEHFGYAPFPSEEQFEQDERLVNPPPLEPERDPVTVWVEKPVRDSDSGSEIEHPQVPEGITLA